MSTLPSSLPGAQSTIGSVATGFLSGAGTGSVAGPIGTVVGGLVGAVSGLIGSIFGGGPDTPTEQQQVIAQLQAYFPDQNSLICGQTFDLAPLNGGLPLWATLPCDNPSYSNVSRSTLEWFIKTYGLASFLQFIKPFLSTTLGGVPGSATQPPPAVPTSGLDTSLGNLTSTLSGVIGAITGAIDASTASASASQQAGIGAVTGTLGVITSGLGNLQQNIGGVITSGITGLLDSLFNPSGSVTGAITSAIEQLGVEQGGLLAQLTNAIESQIGPLEQSLLGLPISLGAILKDIFSNLPKILIDLVNVFPGPLKDIVHAIEVLTGHLPGNANSKIDWSDFGNVLANIAKAAEGIAGVATSSTNTVYQPRDLLTAGCSYEEQLDKWNQASKSVVEVPDWVAQAIHALGTVAIEVMRILPQILQWEHLAEESVNEACPVNKLGPGDVIEGVIRGYLDHTQAVDELKKQGFNESRIKVMGDLARYLEQPATAIDMWWRNIFTDDELSTILQQNAYSDAQVEAAKKASFRITSVGEAVDAYNRGIITDDQFSIILTANRFDDNQIDLARALRRRPPGPAEALRGNLNRAGLGQLSIPFITDFDTVPDYLVSAGKSAGLDDASITDLWWSHWNLGSIESWITAYFRGRRIYSELVGVSGTFGIPETYLSDLVDISRPLIPFRTIPAMIKAGIITQDRGRQLLAQHGFDSQSIDDLLKYATVGTKTSKATTAATQHDISLATARTAYDDGILTQDQYMQLLQAHGLDANAAGVEVQIANISQEVKARKQISTDIVNEYNAGLLDQQAAIQQLATSGLSVAEQAAAVRKMKSGASSKAKQPSEAELRAWAKADIITPDEYQNRLMVIGWSSTDAANFRSLHFPTA